MANLTKEDAAARVEAQWTSLAEPCSMDYLVCLHGELLAWAKQVAQIILIKDGERRRKEPSPKEG